MMLSTATGRDQLGGLGFEEKGRPFVGAALTTTKCCSTGTCDGAPAGTTSCVEWVDTRDPVALAASLGSLDWAVKGSGVFSDER